MNFENIKANEKTKKEQKNEGCEGNPDWAEDPFSRRESIPRTPPRARKTSLPDNWKSPTRSEIHEVADAEDEIIVEQRSKKRKGDFHSPPKRIHSPGERTKTLKELAECTTLLVAFARDNKNVHKEIKRWAGEIKSLVKRAVEEGTYEQHQMAALKEEYNTYKKEQDEKMRRLVEAARHQKTETVTESVNMSTQTELAAIDISTKDMGTWGRRVTAEKLRQISSFKDFEDVKEELWPEELYSKVKVLVGNPLATQDEHSVVLVEPHDAKMDTSIQRRYRDRYPELIGLAEDYDQLETITIRRINEVQTQVNRKVSKIKLNDYKEHMWEQLTRLKREATSHGDTAITIHKLAGLDTKTMAKMVLAVFWNAQTEVKIFTPSEVDLIKREKKPAQTTAYQAVKKPRERKTYALIVDNTQKDYEALLDEVKGKIATCAASRAIKTVRSTKEGNLLIATERDKDALNELKETLLGGTTKVKVRAIGQSEKVSTLHIRGLDATSKAADILAALKKIIGEVEGKQFKLTDLRPNIRNTQTATLIINEADAEKILRNGVIRVGFVNCKVEKRIPITRCFRCWAFEHTSENCKGLDRSGMCFKCGKEGHTQSNCPNEEECPLCNKSGHRAGSGKCPNFRKVLNKRRTQIRAITDGKVEGSQIIADQASAADDKDSTPNYGKC